MAETISLEQLTPEIVSQFPPEVLEEAFRKHERILARSLLEDGDIAGWAQGLRIRTPTGIVPMVPYWYQAKLWEAGRKQRFRILLKARQIGITEAIVIEMLANALTRPNSTQLFVSARQEIANDALQKLKDILRREGPAGSKLSEDTKISAVLENGARIYSLPANEDAVLGYAATRVYLDEFAHMPWAEQIYEQVFPTVSHDGFLTIVSTPRGQSGRFFDIWQGANAGENNFRHYRIHWAQCPAYNPEGWNKGRKLAEKIAVGQKHTWYQAMRPQFSDVEWQRQYECDFVASVDLFFSDSCISWLRGQTKAPIEEERIGNGTLRIYAEPKRSGKYVLGCDSASGLSDGDWSVVVVLEASTCEQVALLRGRWPLAEFAHRINGLRARYDGVIIVERNGAGIAVLDKLEELNSRGLYRSQDGKLGWVTSVKTRTPMLSGLEEAIRTRTLKIRSEEFIDEALTFVRDERGIPGAARGKHDDLIMATAMAWRARQESPKTVMTVTPWAYDHWGESRTGY